MSAVRAPKPVQIGISAEEPIRLTGLITIFELQAEDGQQRHLTPVIGTLDELMAKVNLEYLVVDLNAAHRGIETLDSIRRLRPDLKLIVLGPDGNDELVLNSIIAGARAYLDSSAGPQTVRKAIQAVIGGSIWAPRRLLSKLIDRLLHRQDASLTNGKPHLTVREQQVLELILLARSNREIASQLGIEERTVKAHVGRLMRKNGVDNRIELSMRAISRSLVPKASAEREKRFETGDMTLDMTLK